MLKFIRSKVLFLLKISLLIIILYYIISDVDFYNTLSYAKEYSTFGLIAILIIVVMPEFIFALRWIYSTKEKYGFLVSLKTNTLVGVVGLFTPAKLGEFLPLVYLKKYYNVNSHSTMATLLIVKFLDIIMLASMAVIASFSLFENIDFKLSSVLFLLFLWSCIWCVFFYKELSYRLCYLFPNRKVKAYLIKTLRSIYNTMDKSRIYLIIFFTFLQWLGYFIVTATFLLIVANFDLTIGEVFIVFVISSIGISFPLAPSGFVTYQASLILSLGWYGIDKESALASSIVLHLIQLFPPLILYTILFVFSKNRVKIEDLYDNKQ